MVDKAKACREAAVTGWRRHSGYTLEEVQRAYRDAKPKQETARTGDDAEPLKGNSVHRGAGAPSSLGPGSSTLEPSRHGGRLPKPREETPSPRETIKHPRPSPPPRPRCATSEPTREVPRETSEDLADVPTELPTHYYKGDKNDMAKEPFKAAETSKKLPTKELPKTAEPTQELSKAKMEEVNNLRETPRVREKKASKETSKETPDLEKTARVRKANSKVHKATKMEENPATAREADRAANVSTTLQTKEEITPDEAYESTLVIQRQLIARIIALKTELRDKDCLTLELPPDFPARPLQGWPLAHSRARCSLTPGPAACLLKGQLLIVHKAQPLAILGHPRLHPQGPAPPAAASSR